MGIRNIAKMLYVRENAARDENRSLGNLRRLSCRRESRMLSHRTSQKTYDVRLIETRELSSPLFRVRENVAVTDV